MSCNGCRVLRKGCSDTCILRPSLQWLETAEAQGHATLFITKFFGRAGLMSFISAVPENHRPALFQSLLFEAVGRTVNPVNGVVGLLGSGNWHVCKAAVETVLRGGTLRPMSEFSDESFMCTEMLKIQEPSFSSRVRVHKRRRMFEDPERVMQLSDLDLTLTPGFKGQRKGDSTNVKRRLESPSRYSGESVTTTCGIQPVDNEIKLLNLF